MVSLYYIQDSRKWDGNNMVFWKKNEKGYTMHLDEAKLCSKEEADKIHANRKTDIPRLKEDVEECASMQVDIQRFNSSEDTEKPLFIPLKTEFYNMFISGEKGDELRKYGARWNEKTCRVGRPVLLSKGYGKHSRARSKVTSFKKQHGSLFGSSYQGQIMKCFGTLDLEIAVIGLEQPVETPNV